MRSASAQKEISFVVKYAQTQIEIANTGEEMTDLRTALRVVKMKFLM